MALWTLPTLPCVGVVQVMYALSLSFIVFITGESRAPCGCPLSELMDAPTFLAAVHT